MKAGVVVFPGSNCDHDTYHVVKHVMQASCAYLWHKDEDLQGCDLIILPGGFSYGDYMRTGAIARFSPIMEAVRRFADGGGRVLGICNGFQILLEAGLLPGAMLKNVQLKFVCRHVHIRVETAATPYTARCAPGQVLRLPVAHHEGNYYADEATLEDLRRHDQIVFRYCDPDGQLSWAANPNGSLDNIAGICNRGRNVLGMMPHPERAAEEILASADGRAVFESLMGA
jgi:phosphoribosylformylglycinamidine synthase I